MSDRELASQNEKGSEAVSRLPQFEWEALALQRQYRLTRDDEFKQLRSKGRSWANPLVVLYTLPSDQDITRIGISASKRVGKAVKRNRAKRLIREAIRLRYPEISPGWNLLFVARKPVAEARFEQASAAVEQLLRRAGLLTRPSEPSGYRTRDDKTQKTGRIGAGQRRREAHAEPAARETGRRPEALQDTGSVIDESSGA